MSSIITSKLTLSGTGITSDALLIIQSADLVITTPAIESGTLSLSSTSIATNLLPINSLSRTFLYVKNTGSVGVSPNISLKTGGAVRIADIAPTEWLFIPLTANIVIDAFLVSAGTSTLEYSYFTAT